MKKLKGFKIDIPERQSSVGVYTIPLEDRTKDHGDYQLGFIVNDGIDERRSAHEVCKDGAVVTTILLTEEALEALISIGVTILNK